MTLLHYILLFLPACINLWALWHVLKASSLDTVSKVKWVAFLIFVPVLAGIAYFFCRYLPQKRV